MSIQPGTGYTFSASSQGTNFNIQTPWAHWPLIGDGFECSPFKVHDVKYNAGGEGGSYVTFEICPGLMNNYMPQTYNTTTETYEYLDGLTEGFSLIIDFASTTAATVYLRVGPDSTTKAFPPTSPNPSDPDDPYPRIYAIGGALPSDSNTFGYVAIAKITEVSAKVYKVTQYVTGSLWGDRIKTGTDTARYYYARI